jgi:DNA-binding LytR/AlgR family response regulator
MKPYTISKFVGTLARIFPANESPKDLSISPDDFFFVKNKDEHLKIVKINYSDVVAVESKLNYVQIHTLSKKILTYMSLSEISKTLRHLQFFVQFQRSFIIGKRHIESIDGNTIKMVTGLQITVGEYYRKDFSAFLTERLIKAGRKT